MIGRRGRIRTEKADPELVFKRARAVEAELRSALAIFRTHLEELEAEIRQEEV